MASVWGQASRAAGAGVTCKAAEGCRHFRWQIGQCSCSRPFRLGRVRSVQQAVPERQRQDGNAQIAVLSQQQHLCHAAKHVRLGSTVLHSNDAFDRAFHVPMLYGCM